MLSTDDGFFLPSKRKDLLQHIVDNEVSALARLTFYENLLTGQEISVRINGLNLGKMQGVSFPRDKEN